MVRVVTHQGRHVERGRQPGLTMVEQIAEALVRLLRRPKPRELAHGPQPPAIHRRVHTTGKGKLARKTDLLRVGKIGRGVQRLDRLARDGREERLPLRRARIALAEPALRVRDRPGLDGHRARSLGPRQRNSDVRPTWWGRCGRRRASWRARPRRAHAMCSRNPATTPISTIPAIIAMPPSSLGLSPLAARTMSKKAMLPRYPAPPRSYRRGGGQRTAERRRGHSAAAARSARRRGGAWLRPLPRSARLARRRAARATSAPPSRRNRAPRGRGPSRA